MKNLILSFFLIGFSNAFSNQSWKSAGEYFENQYLNGLQDQLKEGDTCIGKPPSLRPLKQAFLIYQLEAQRGDVDAQFRLGMYEKAAAGGHEYANLYVEALKDQENVDSGAFCSFYAGLLFSGKKTKSNPLHYVESLALLGNPNCMLALGRHQSSQYWLQRAVLAAPSQELEGEVSYELALVLQKDESCYPKLILARMECATRCENSDARLWLKRHRTADGILAYSQLVQDLGQPIYAADILRSLADKPQSSDPWTHQDRYKDRGANTAGTIYQQAIVQVLKELPAGSKEFTLDTIRELLAAIPQERSFVEPILTLYESVAPVEFVQNNEILDLVSSWSSQITSLRQLDRALKLRRLLIQVLDVSKLDDVLNGLFKRFDSSDEAFLKEILEVKSQDLVLFFFKRVFSNELSQLEISMQLEDLFSGVGSLYPGKPQTLQALQILASGGKSVLVEFPKLACTPI